MVHLPRRLQKKLVYFLLLISHYLSVETIIFFLVYTPYDDVLHGLVSRIRLAKEENYLFNF